MYLLDYGDSFILELEFPKFQGQHWFGSNELLLHCNLTVDLSFVPTKKLLFVSRIWFTFFTKELFSYKQTNQQKTGSKALIAGKI